MRPVIYRLHEPPPHHEVKRDYRSVYNLGRMVTILGHRVTPSVNPVECERLMRVVLQHAVSTDYILWCGGDPMSAFLAGKILGELGLGHIRWLRWDRRIDSDGARTREGFYTPVIV